MPELEAVLVVAGNERHKAGAGPVPCSAAPDEFPCTALLHIAKNSTGWTLTSHLSHGLAGEQL